MNTTRLACCFLFMVLGAVAGAESKDVQAADTGTQPAETIVFERPDGATLHAVWQPATSKPSPGPAILLLHQAQRSGAEFDFLMDDLHALGIHTLALDLRGHGNSTRPADLDRAFFMKLFRDPDFAPPDVQAVLQWLADHEQVDAARIAAMGGSVGANLSYVANGAGWGVKTAVVLSGNAEAAADLQGDIDPFQPRSVLLLAADDDHGRDAYAQRMFEGAAEPKHVEILADSSAHGTDLLQESTELKAMVMDWLRRELVAP